MLVHATCIRPYSHSLSDDEKLYKTKAERADEARRDPIVTFPEWLIARRHSRPPRPRTAHARSGPRDPGGHRPRAQSRAASEGLRAAVSLFGARRSDVGGVRGRAAIFGRPAHHGRRNQSHAARRDAAQRADRGVRRGCRRFQPRGEPCGSEGQGRRVQSHAGLQIEFGSTRCFNTPHRGSRHRRPCHRDGDARAEAGSRDSVFRLHLAGHDADPR